MKYTIKMTTEGLRFNQLKFKGGGARGKVDIEYEVSKELYDQILDLIKKDEHV